ncbi:MAG: hypothetical protein JO290_05910 [Sphingomonadaceae bacterium]|nr:hypothetical protein [Sphingomonadaceae bacterium]
MKFDILTAAATEGTSRLIDDGYVYAWERNLYPWFHSGAPWHQPFKNDFAVTEEMMSEAITFLDDRWIGNSAIPSFYELERLFDARSNASRWDRSKLISVCRYAFLCERFDARLFDRLLAKGEHPIEASLIVEQFNRDDAIYLM